jgi:hypothetical protein
MILDGEGEAGGCCRTATKRAFVVGKTSDGRWAGLKTTVV